MCGSIILLVSECITDIFEPPTWGELSENAEHTPHLVGKTRNATNSPENDDALVTNGWRGESKSDRIQICILNVHTWDSAVANVSTLPAMSKIVTWLTARQPAVSGKLTDPFGIFDYHRHRPRSAQIFICFIVFTFYDSGNGCRGLVCTITAELLTSWHYPQCRIGAVALWPIPRRWWLTRHELSRVGKQNNQ